MLSSLCNVHQCPSNSNHHQKHKPPPLQIPTLPHWVTYVVAADVEVEEGAPAVGQELELVTQGDDEPGVETTRVLRSGGQADQHAYHDDDRGGQRRVPHVRHVVWPGRVLTARGVQHRVSDTGTGKNQRPEACRTNETFRLPEGASQEQLPQNQTS